MRFVCPTVLLALLGVVPASAAVIVNGGFETGDFTGWTQSGNQAFSGVAMGSPHSGAYAAFFGPMTTLGYIEQSVTTAPSASYDLTFWLSNDSSFGASQFEVYWDGSLIYLLTDPGDFGYSLVSIPVVASGASTQVKFGFRHDPSFFHIDDIAVNAGSGGEIPEPSAWLLFASGFGLLLLSARKRIG